MLTVNTSSLENQMVIPKRKSPFLVLARRLSQNSSAVIGFVVGVLLALMAIFAPIIAPYPYAKQDLTHTRAAPSSEHISKYLYQRISERLNNDNIKVDSITVWESDNASARYYE